MKLVILLFAVATFAACVNSTNVDDENNSVSPAGSGTASGTFEKLVRNKRRAASRYSGTTSRFGSSNNNKGPSMSPFNRPKGSDEFFGRRYSSYVPQGRPSNSPFNRPKGSEEFFGRRYNSYVPQGRPSNSPFNRPKGSEEFFGRQAGGSKSRGRAMAMTRIPGEPSDEFFGK